ncbi:MAG: carbon-nitrogen family hydrolase [Candidatus Omnitrophica bacterium]|nr:carbon-nitrogen family hydrolase [Candidatus Omnitrophota bacterium]
MKICLCQYSIIWENKQKNKEKIENLFEKSILKNVNLIVFPEMSLTGFSFNKNITQLTDDDFEFFSNIAKKYSSYVSFGALKNGKNVCITVNPEGKIISQTGKIHLFSPSGEHKQHKDSSKVHQFVLGKTRITPFICYDLRFAPLFWIYAENTDIFLVLANWPESRKTHWKILLQARAIENQAYVAGINRTGISPDNKYCGNSCVIDPWGKIILDAKNKEGIFVCDIEQENVSKIRSEFPVLKDRKRFIEYAKKVDNG